MERLIQLSAVLCISIFTGLQVAAQCSPDTTCKDNDNNGEFCPKNLPDASLNEAYEAVITVIPPSSFDYQGNVLEIVYIEVDSVLNLPPGISYTANADKFYADTAYCILLSGTPLEKGDFTLAIYVTPTITSQLTGVIKGPQVVNDTSVVLSVLDPSGLEPFSTNEFQVFQNFPNPFHDVTRIGFYTPVNDLVELKIYNILGELIHQETSLTSPGKHYFRFDGNNLFPGPYFYQVRNSSSFYTGKFIKAK